MKQYFPSVTPHTTVAFAPIVAPRFTSVCWYSCFRLTWLRGFTTLVKTADGPQKTSSSRVTPVYTDTLFWIFTLSPMTQPGESTTFWPMLQSRPIAELAMMWQKCQILVFFPMVQGPSTNDDSCTKNSRFTPAGFIIAPFPRLTRARE